jgi:hypothetical protein
VKPGLEVRAAQSRHNSVNGEAAELIIAGLPCSFSFWRRRRDLSKVSGDAEVIFDWEIDLIGK